MKIADIPIGKRLEIELFDEFDERAGPVFASKVEWVEDENAIYISAPIYENVLVPVKVGTNLNAYFVHEGNLYLLKTVILDREKRDNIALLKLKAREEIIKFQRRRYFRLEIELPVKLWELDPLAELQGRERKFFKGITRNISGGGLSVLLTEEIKPEKLLEIELEVGKRHIKFVGKVVRSERFENGKAFKYEIGVDIKKIKDQDREAIIKFIFREQRKLIKKGLI